VKATFVLHLPPMNKLTSIQHRKGVSLILALLCVFLSVVNSNLEQANHPVAQDTENAAQTPQDHAHDVILKLQEAVQSSFQVNVSFQSFLVEIIGLPEKEGEEKKETNQFFQGQTKHFIILLERVISPNAP